MQIAGFQFGGECSRCCCRMLRAGHCPWLAQHRSTKGKCFSGHFVHPPWCSEKGQLRQGEREVLHSLVRGTVAEHSVWGPGAADAPHATRLLTALALHLFPYGKRHPHAQSHNTLTLVLNFSSHGTDKTCPAYSACSLNGAQACFAVFATAFLHCLRYPWYPQCFRLVKPCPQIL